MGNFFRSLCGRYVGKTFGIDFININYLFIFIFSDVGCVQISPDSQKGFESQTRHAPIVRFEIVENANQISGPAMAKIKYENNVSYLHQS